MQNNRLSFVANPGVPQGCIMSAQTERLIYKILKSSKSLASGGRSTTKTSNLLKTKLCPLTLRFRFNERVRSKMTKPAPPGSI